MKVSIVTGGAGFIGSNLINSLIKEHRYLFVIDSLIRGNKEYIEEFDGIDDRVIFFKADLSDIQQAKNAFSVASKYGQVDEVWHLAANSDIPAGINDTSIDLRDTFMTTYCILESMQIQNITTIHFASSSAIYGDLGDSSIHESVGPLLPISSYGAMKLASEALISAAAEKFLKKGNLFRFPNVVGAPATHGVIFDFINRLKIDSRNLVVLGDGTQMKAYLHVSDLISAMLYIRSKSNTPKVFPINIGPMDDGVTVRFIAETVKKRVSPEAIISYGSGNKGWIGDVPKFRYCVQELNRLGWKPKQSSADSIFIATHEIANQLGV